MHRFPSATSDPHSRQIKLSIAVIAIAARRFLSDFFTSGPVFSVKNFTMIHRIILSVTFFICLFLLVYKLNLNRLQIVFLTNEEYFVSVAAFSSILTLMRSTVSANDLLIIIFVLTTEMFL